MRKISFVIALLFINGVLAQSEDEAKNSSLKDFAEKESVTILITDSGLGGLVVCADIEKRLHHEHPFKSVKIIFCNALPESDYGYNTMSSTEEKIQVFSDALSGMTKWYSPDIIVIACNTLSVLYEQTEYSRTAEIPVISIVEVGVDLMTGVLNNDPNSSVIIYGTETTIETAAHKSLLLKNGIAEDRIVTQACPDLAGEIQNDASSDAVATMIEFYSDDAVKKLSPTHGSVYVSLCCTHFGYAADKFHHAVINSSKRKTILIDPTQSMSNVIFLPRSIRRFKFTTTNMHVVSRAIITPQEIHSIGELIRQQSEPTTAALQEYELKKDLFEFQRKR